MTPTIQDLVYQNASVNQISQAAQKEGFLELHDAALKLLRDGVTTFEEVLPYLPTATFIKTSGMMMPSVPNLGDPNQVPTVGLAQGGRIPSEGGKLQKPKILLVEDNLNLRKIMRQVLTKQMFDVYEAGDGLEGLEKVYEANPDIILCDLNMPRMGGKEFVIKLKNNAQTMNIPIVMLTDADMEDNEVGLLEVGADDFISKSSSYKVILARLAKMQKRQ
jgi:CheY-like chemotaxis protein